MAMAVNGGEALTGTLSSNGATVPAGTGETAAIVALGTGATLTATTTNQAHGSQALQLNPAASQLISIKSWALGASVQGACDFEIKCALAAPGSGITDQILQLRSNTGNVYTLSRVGTASNFRVSGSSDQNYTGYGFDPTVYKRVGFAWNIDTVTPSNSKYRLITTALDSDSLLFDTAWVGLTPTTPNVGVDTVSFGRIGASVTDTSPVYLDNIRIDPVSTDVIPFAGSLKPTITLDKSGTVAVGTVVTATVGSTLGSGFAKTNAMRVQYSANGNFTDTTTTDTAAGVLSYTLQNAGSYRFLALVKQDPI